MISAWSSTLSDRDNGEAAGFVLGQAPVPVVGGQTSEVYGVGTVFIVGGGLSYSDYNIYPVPADISYNTCIVDNIANPTAIYMRDRDFIIRNGTLVIRKEFDPFNSDSVFKQVSANGETKAVLWFIDAMTDNNYVEDYIGYVFGFRPGVPHSIIKTPLTLYGMP